MRRLIDIVNRQNTSSEIGVLWIGGGRCDWLFATMAFQVEFALPIFPKNKKYGNKVWAHRIKCMISVKR